LTQRKNNTGATRIRNEHKCDADNQPQRQRGRKFKFYFMKLESLKSSKFEAFKANEIQNLFAINGGAMNTEIDNHCFQDKTDASVSQCYCDRASGNGTDVYYYYNGDWVPTKFSQC
jgi:hypothetical protein